jgi:hypothetical protein
MTLKTSKRKLSLWSLVLGTLITTSLSAGKTSAEVAEKKGSIFSSFKKSIQKKANDAKDQAIEKGLSATCGLCASPKIFVLSKSETALNVALKNCIKNCIQRKYTLRVMQDSFEEVKPVENEIYVKKQDNGKLKCKLLNLKGEVVERTIDYSTGVSLSETILRDAEKPILTQLSKKGDIWIAKGVNTLLDDLMAQKAQKKEPQKSMGAKVEEKTQEEEASKEGTGGIEENQENQEEIKNIEKEIAELEQKIGFHKERPSTSMTPKAIELLEGKIKDLIEKRDKLKKPSQNLESVPNQNRESVPENSEIEHQIKKIKKVAIEVVKDLNSEKEKKTRQLGTVEKRIISKKGNSKKYNSKSLDKKVLDLKSEVNSLISKINAIQKALDIPDIWQRGS